MGYSVKLTETAKEKLEELDNSKQEEFASQIDKLEDFPKKYGKPLKGRLHGYWQLRFSQKYRIWYTVSDEDEKVVVEAIYHKDEAQKRY
ncbi:MAG: type II toxin-antitoxin system RelE/ParE family toxin [Candidatus Nanohaloarchaea archaeon]